MSGIQGATCTIDVARGARSHHSIANGRKLARGGRWEQSSTWLSRLKSNPRRRFDCRRVPTPKYAYTTLGYLQQITDNGTGAVYWTANAWDAEMHLTSAFAGSGVTTTQAFDPNTGLAQSILAGLSNSVSNQAFTFNTLGRLTPDAKRRKK